MSRQVWLYSWISILEQWLTCLVSMTSEAIAGLDTFLREEVIRTLMSSTNRPPPSLLSRGWAPPVGQMRAPHEHCHGAQRARKPKPRSGRPRRDGGLNPNFRMGSRPGRPMNQAGQHNYCVRLLVITTPTALLCNT